MKPLKTVLVVCLLCLTTAGYSQSTARHSLFSAQPERLDCTTRMLSEAFNYVEGDALTLTFADNVSFSGKVISNVAKYSNLQSVTIQLPGYENAVFHLSRQTNPDNTYTYVGRIMQQNANDGYMIEKNGNDYSLKKINAERVLEVCQ